MVSNAIKAAVKWEAMTQEEARAEEHLVLFCKEQRKHWKRFAKFVAEYDKGNELKKVIEGWIDSCQFAQADLMTLTERRKAK